MPNEQCMLKLRTTLLFPSLVRFMVIISYNHGQVTVLLPTATVWSRFCGAASDWVTVTLIPSE